MTPDAVAMEKATAPKKKIPRALGVKNTSAWVLQPTVKPRNIVAVSMMADWAVFARRSTTPHSVKKFPKNTPVEVESVVMRHPEIVEVDASSVICEIIKPHPECRDGALRQAQGELIIVGFIMSKRRHSETRTREPALS